MKYIILLWSLFIIPQLTSSQTWNELNDSLVHYYNNGEYGKGVAVGEKALILGKKQFGETHPYYATSLNNLAGLYQRTGQYEKAEPLYIQAKELRKNLLGETNPEYIMNLQNLALLYFYMGQYEKAEPFYLQAKESWKKTQGENSLDYATILSNLAGLYMAKGQYDKAELSYLLATEILKKVFGENHPHVATGLNNLATLYQGMGQYEKTEQLYIGAKEILEKGLDETHPYYIQLLNNLATLYMMMGQYKNAEFLYIQAKDIGKRTAGENTPDNATNLNNLGELYRMMGKYPIAETLYIQAKDIRKNVLGEDHPDYVSSLNNLGTFYLSIGQYEKAEVLLTQALAARKKILGETHPDYATSLGNLALLYEAMGQYEKAEKFHLLNSQVILKNLENTFTILSEKEKGIYLYNNISVTETNNSFLYYYRKASPAIIINNFNLQLFFKALSLTDTRSMIESINNSKDSSVRQRFTAWQSNKKLLAQQYSLPMDMRRPDIASLEVLTENHEKELTRGSAAFRSQQNTTRVSIKDVQKNLNAGEAVVEFVRFTLFNKKWTDSTVYAAYILRKNDSVPLFVLLCEEKQLQQLFDSAGSTATTMVSSFYRGLEGTNQNAATLGKELYKLVWQPLEVYLRGIKKVSYSPAGKLYSIAFHALPVDRTTILLDKYHLQQYTSTRQIAFRNPVNQITKPESITLFGNASFTMDSLQLVKQNKARPRKENVYSSIYRPQKRSSDSNLWDSLPGTAEEVEKIKQLFDQNKTVPVSFVQTAASEENLKALSGNSPQILHIATHGFFLPEPGKKTKETRIDQGNTYTLSDDPLLRSGLILAGGNYAWSGKTPVEEAEDGIATAYEISQLNLSKTELVVLSACETALGDVKGSEGVFGLQRAFKMAGVKKMIVSLWQVPDKETAELMTAFYTYWMKGKTINDAFAQAQAEMRKKYSPFYWAAFVLVE